MASVLTRLPSAGLLRIAAVATLAAAAASVTGCSWRQAYDTAQGWQRNQCYRLVEQTERERCLGNTNTAYDDYRRQAAKSE